MNWWFILFLAIWIHKFYRIGFLESWLNGAGFSPKVQSSRARVGVMWRDRDPHGELPKTFLKPIFIPDSISLKSKLSEIFRSHGSHYLWKLWRLRRSYQLGSKNLGRKLRFGSKPPIVALLRALAKRYDIFSQQSKTNLKWLITVG